MFKFLLLLFLLILPTKLSSEINNDYYEDLDEANTKQIIDSLIKDKPLKPGSYRKRINSAPENLNLSKINGELDA